MLRGLWRQGNASSASLDALAENQQLNSAMRAAMKIMDDDLEGADAGLSAGTDPFHQLGKSMVVFLRATFGFEQEVMKEASGILAEAESAASNAHRRAQKDPHTYHSPIYPFGTEYALCQAMTQLMAAVVAVLNESLTESIKGFYKLRKAYITLDSILNAEAAYGAKLSRVNESATARNPMHSNRSSQSFGRGLGHDANSNGIKSAPITRPGSMHGDLLSQAPTPPSHHRIQHRMPLERIESEQPEELDSDDDVFVDATENHGEDHVEVPAKPHEDVTAGNENSSALLNHDPDSDVFSNEVDSFIHSGANMCFGLLLLMISMIPPAFARLLVIIGFRGDKEKGLRLLWQSSKFHNINGAMAGLTILGYYNTIMSLNDVMPDAKPTEEHPSNGHPKERCARLLMDMRARHPRSHLWLLEESRETASNKKLDQAIALLKDSSVTPLKQVEALKGFEMSLEAMYSHRFQLCADSFVRCVSLNNWSHALYYYIAGSAHLELYRDLKISDPKRAAAHAEQAEKFLTRAPEHAGKKKFMARQLPFDALVSRKLKKWQARAEQWQVPLVEAVGVSPIEEMIFFWAGYKRMNQKELEESLQRLEKHEQSPQWAKEDADERAVSGVLRAATLRNLGRYEEASEVLQLRAIDVDRNELKGGFKDNWTCPAAHYEMGTLCWIRSRQLKHEPLEEERLVKECRQWIDKVVKWESYDLDARFGLKIAMAEETLKLWEAQRVRRQVP